MYSSRKTDYTVEKYVQSSNLCIIEGFNYCCDEGEALKEKLDKFISAKGYGNDEYFYFVPKTFEKKACFGFLDQKHNPDFYYDMLFLAKALYRPGFLMIKAGNRGAKAYFRNGSVKEIENCYFDKPDSFCIKKDGCGHFINFYGYGAQYSIFSKLIKYEYEHPEFPTPSFYDGKGVGYEGIEEIIREDLRKEAERKANRKARAEERRRKAEEEKVGFLTSEAD